MSTLSVRFLRSAVGTAAGLILSLGTMAQPAGVAGKAVEPPPGGPAVGGKAASNTPPTTRPGTLPTGPSAGAAGSVATVGNGPGPVGQGAAGNYAAPQQFNCAPTYTKTNQQLTTPGGKSAHFECESPTIVQCPDKSVVRHAYGGAPAAGMGIEVKAVPVGQVGDYNRYKIQYRCTYFWNNG